MQDETAHGGGSTADLRRRLEEFERRFRSFLATAADWCWEADPEGRLTWLSRESILPPRSLIGLTRWEAADVDPAADPLWRAHRADLAAGRPFRGFRYSLSRPDGRPLHCEIGGDPQFDAAGRLIGWLGTGRDVTAEVEAAAQIEESRARLAAERSSAAASERLFRDLVEGSLQGVLIVQNRCFVYVNQALCRISGYAQEELLQAGRWLIVAPEDLARFKRALADGPAGRADFQGIRKDGARLWLECLIRPIVWGDAPAWQVVVMDVTDRRRAEEQLRHVHRMEAIGQLTGGVAHDFNNLLAVMLGNLDLIREAGVLPPAEARMLENVTAAASRGARLTRSLLAFARRQQLNPERCDINLLVVRAAELFGRTLGGGIEVATRLTPGLPPINVDLAQLEAALLNLAVNARDAMPEGGRIVVETGATTLTEGDSCEAIRDAPGGYVTLSISDTGVGMTAEVRERAFEPFFTTKDVGKGTGLGLSMVYGFVKQSGGFVRLRSEPGSGSTFTLCFPAAATGDDAAADRPEAPANGAEGWRVLVVEDDADVRKAVVATLESLGCAAHAEADGVGALRALAGPEPFDLLLTDVVLPGRLRGVEIAHEARRLRPRLKILFMTGYAPQALESSADAADGPTLGKPFRRSDMARALARLRGR